MYATVMGIGLKSVSCKVTGDIDLRGLVGLADKKGFDAVTVDVTLDAPGHTQEELEGLKAAVDAHCPLVATLRSEIPVTTTIVHTQAASASEALAKDPCTAEGISAVIAAGKEDETALKSKYTSTSKLATDGLETNVEMPLGHKLVVDEPTTMPGGNNAGPNPLDLFCASFGTCQEITYKMYGTVMGIPINSVACSVKAPTDLCGLVGLNDDAVAIKSVNATITIDSPATQAQLDQLKGAVDASCPMAETLKMKTPVTLNLVPKET